MTWPIWCSLISDELHGSHPDAKSRRSLSFSTPRTNPKSRLAGFAASPLTPGQSPALGRMPSLDSPITSRGRVISDDMDDSFGNPLQLSLTEEDGEADLVIDEGEDKENQGVRASKKRTQDDMFQGLSDDEEDPLVDEGAMPDIGEYYSVINDSFKIHVEGLVQERRNSSVLAMELRLYYINPLMYSQLKPHTSPMNVSVVCEFKIWTTILIRLWHH